MRTLFILAIGIGLSLGCKSQKNENQAMGNLWIETLWVEGNQMPGPGKEMSAGKPVSREVVLFAPLKISQMEGHGPVFEKMKEKPLQILTTTEKGTVEMSLPAGQYSVFTKEASGLFANSFDGEGYIQLIEIRKDETTRLTIQINYEAAY
jgi:hypothetical protein